MKKILILLFALLWHCCLFADGNSVYIKNHSTKGTYNNRPVYILFHDEELQMGFNGVVYSNGSLHVYINSEDKGWYQHGNPNFNTSQLEAETLYLFQIRNGGASATCYIVINTPSLSTCSKTKKTITQWQGGNISRWERSYDGGSTWTNLSCTSYQYTESNPAAGSAMYRVLGTDGTYSDVVTIKYVDAVPSTIQATPATNTITVDESVTLTANVTDNGYSYQWKKNGTNISGATKRTYTISKIKSSHAGNYTCDVSNGCNGVTTTTAKLTVNKCAQTINFPEIPTQTYSSGLTYTLPEKTNKGLTITYQSMNTSVATVSGNTLTIKAPGTAIISASQPGDDNYLEATQVSRTLTVNKRSQTITFNALPTKTYEDLPFTLPQKTNEGLTISYRSTNTSVATVSGNTVTILKPGTTDIIASQAGDATHYSAAEVSQTLTVNKAAQQITFGALPNKRYGDAAFTLNKVSNKNLDITYTSSDVSVATISGNVVTIKKPGTITITATQAGNAYYLAAEPVTQTLLVKKADQVINFPAIESRAFDSPDFTLPAQTDKGLTITYASSDTAVATVSKNIVHIVGAGTTEITAIQNGNDYYFHAPSVTQSFTVTKAYQTINFQELQTCVFGQEPITLNATVNSGFAVEYESSDYSVATVNGNQLTIVGAGQCYISASSPGNKNYYTATPVERRLIVNKAQQVIEFASFADEYTYGDSPIALVANSSTGVVQFTSSNPSKLMIVGTNAIIQGAGHFTVTASLAEDANHLPASLSQEVVVNKANLTVTAYNVSRVYGDINPAFTCNYSGFVNGDTKMDLNATIQVSSAARQTSPAGTYEIVATSTTDDNYNIICKKGVLTIDKAPLTISAQATREYGDNNPDFVIDYSGFKNNEDSNVLTSQPQAYTTARKTSPVGTYPIYISGASAQNYSISYEDGVLTIVKAPLTIRVMDATRKRLEENPQFELSISGYKLEDSIDDLDHLPTIQCAANINSPAGTYPIILLNDGYATNYEYILINGTLTVEKLKYTINVASQDETKGTVSGSGLYDEDEVITISATPLPHHYFVTWNDGDSNPSRTMVVSQDASYIAYFAVNRYSLTVSSNDANMGTVSGSGEYEYGATAELEAVARDGYHFTQWSDGNTDNPRNINVTTDESYSAIFAKNIYSITIVTDNEQGSVSSPTEAEYLDQVILTALPEYGYHFTHWSDGNTDNPRNITVTQDESYSANFAKNIYSITIVTDKEQGSVSCPTEAEYLDQVILTALPEYGYHFTHWSDGNTDNPRNITITQDESYSANFAKNVYTINIVTDNEQGSIFCPTEAEYLDQVTLTALPEYGYHFTQWSDGVTDNPRTFILTRDTTFAAEFYIDKSGTCGEGMMLTWTYEGDKKTLTISGNGNLTDNKRYGIEAINEMKTLVIGNGVGIIGDEAFANIKTLQAVTFGNTISAISDYAFNGCDKLTSVTLPASVTSIGNYAFSGCTMLQHLTLGEEIVQIGDGAFANCLYMLDINALMVLPPVINESVFSGCGDLSSIKCYVPQGSLAFYQKFAVWKEFNLMESSSGEDAIENTSNDATTYVRKEIINGQLFIHRDGKTYTVHGLEVR